MTQLDVSQDQLSIITSILRRQLTGEEVRAFGSRATGAAKRFSDLDLAIVSTAPLPITVIAALREEFDESDLPFRVDLLDWATASESFRSVIASDCVPLLY